MFRIPAFLGRRRRLLGLILLGLGLALGLLWVRSLDVRLRLEEELSAALGTPVRIREMRWRGLSGVTLEGVVAGPAGESVAGIGRLRLVGSPMRLLRRRIALDTLEIAEPGLRLRRDEAGRWNLPILNTPSVGWPGWSVEIAHGRLVSGSVEVAAGASRIRADSLNLGFGVRYRDGAHVFLLSRLNALVVSPPLAIRRVDADVSLRADTLLVSALELTTEGSRVRLSGRVTNLADPAMDLSLTSDRLSTEEVRRFLPSVPGAGDVSLSASAKGGRTGIDLTAVLDTPGGRLEGRGRLRPDPSPPEYDLSLSTSHLDLSRLLGGNATPTDLRCDVSLSGTGFTPGDAVLSASLSGSGSRIGDARFDSLSARLRMKGGRLEASGEVRVAGLGAIRAEGDLDLGSRPGRYRVRADVEDLDLAAATGDAAWGGRLTGRAELEGSGTELDSLDLDGRVLLRASRFGAFRVDGAEARARLRNRVLTLDALTVRGSGGSGRIAGRICFPRDRAPTYGGSAEITGLDLGVLTGEPAFRSELNLKAEVVGDGLEEVALRVEGGSSRIAGVPIRRMEGAGGYRSGAWRLERLDLEGPAGEARLSGGFGPSDSLAIRADLVVADLPSEAIGGCAIRGRVSGTARGHLGNLHLTAAGRADSVEAGTTVWRDATFDLDLRGLNTRHPDAGLRTAVSGDVSIRVGSARVAGLPIRDMIAGAHLEPGVVDLALDIAPADRARIDVAGRVTFDPVGLVARLDTLFVDAGKVRIRNDGPCRLRYAYDGGLRLDHLRIAQEGGALTAAGGIDANGDLQGEALLEGIDLARWQDLLGRKDGLGGRLTLRATAAGKADRPEIAGSVEIADGRAGDFAYRKLAGTFAYREGRADADLRLDQGGEGASGSRGATLRGSLPIPARGEARISAQAQSEELDLSFLQAAFPELREVRGSLRGRLELSGTVGRPALSGFVEIPSGSLRIPEMGLRLTEVRGRLDAEPGRLRIGDLALRTRGGSMSVEGEASLDGMEVRNFNVSVRADAFDLLDRKESQLNFGGTVRARGTPRNPDITWDFTLNRALLPIPEAEASSAGPSPILDLPFVRGMSGRGRLRIPRNAWVRSVDFNTEVQGEVEITKEAEAPFLFFGGLDAIRGQYIFQNARFSIDRGELRFRGTPDNDPDLYLLGTRRIPRALPDAGGNPSQDLLIHIVVGGTLTKSKVTLESDAPTPLDQADLLSYLLFGRPSSQTLLGSLGGGGSTANLQSQAQNLAFGIAANHLKQTVGRELGLDVLEVEVGQGKETFTHLAVGKYVRRDLLLTFSQDVVQAVGQGQDRLGRKVSVEYELGRSFGVSGSVDDQGKTALDLFWKKEW